MSQAKTRLLELNKKLAQILVDKGIEATADETTTALINKVADVSDDTNLRALTGLIQKDVADITIPDGVTSIGNYTFYKCAKLKSVTMPDSVTSIGTFAFLQCSSLISMAISASLISIGTYAFEGCTSLTNITITDSVKRIDDYAFQGCKSLTSVTLPDSVTRIGRYVFNGCSNLTSVTIPASITNIGYELFSYCANLTDVTLGNGFNADSLDLSASTKYTAETIVSWLNALADRTGQTAYKLIIGATNLAKLTEEQVAVATNKNWTLAQGGKYGYVNYKKINRI